MQKQLTASDTRKPYSPPTLSRHGHAVDQTRGCSGWGFENIVLDKSGTTTGGIENT